VVPEPEVPAAIPTVPASTPAISTSAPASTVPRGSRSFGQKLLTRDVDLASLHDRPTGSPRGEQGAARPAERADRPGHGQAMPGDPPRSVGARCEPSAAIRPWLT
jgi:hypothetical protein